jgi:hypothetical protein
MKTLLQFVESAAWLLGIVACAALMAATIAMQYHEWAVVDRSTGALAAAGSAAGGLLAVRFVLVKVGERKGAS